MNARIRKFLNQVGDTFWLVPAVMVLVAIAIALMLLDIDRSVQLPAWLSESRWLYNGGATGARTLLGAIAASTIGVAGTIFSITIAALSLAAGQMGPRLLRNFTRDRGVQFTLGAYLGTFSYALVVLRSVRTQQEGSFTPNLSLTLGIIFAFICIATLIYFVGHMANRINVDTVIDLVSDDIGSVMKSLLTVQAQEAPPAPEFWLNSKTIIDARRGYLQQLDEDGLAEWAAKHGTVVRLLVRRGDYVFPGAPIAVMSVDVKDAELAVREATALSHSRGSAGDIEYVIRQLVDVAVRALSSGINDPHTATNVVDRLGAAMCDLVGMNLPNGVTSRDGVLALVVPNITYPSLVGVMFNMIRQNATNSPTVLIRLLAVLTVVVACETEPDRLAILRQHADLVLADARRSVGNSVDLAEIGRRHALLVQTMDRSSLEAISTSS